MSTKARKSSKKIKAATPEGSQTALLEMVAAPPHPSSTTEGTVSNFYDALPQRKMGADPPSSRNSLSPSTSSDHCLDARTADSESDEDNIQDESDTSHATSTHRRKRKIAPSLSRSSSTGKSTLIVKTSKPDSSQSNRHERESSAPVVSSSSKKLGSSRRQSKLKRQISPSPSPSPTEALVPSLLTKFVAEDLNNAVVKLETENAEPSSNGSLIIQGKKRKRNRQRKNDSSGLSSLEDEETDSAKDEAFEPESPVKKPSARMNKRAKFNRTKSANETTSAASKPAKRSRGRPRTIRLPSVAAESSGEESVRQDTEPLSKANLLKEIKLTDSRAASPSARELRLMERRAATSEEPSAETPDSIARKKRNEKIREENAVKRESALSALQHERDLIESGQHTLLMQMEDALDQHIVRRKAQAAVIFEQRLAELDRQKASQDDYSVTQWNLQKNQMRGNMIFEDEVKMRKGYIEYWPALHLGLPLEQAPGPWPYIPSEGGFDPISVQDSFQPLVPEVPHQIGPNMLTSSEVESDFLIMGFPAPVRPEAVKNEAKSLQSAHRSTNHHRTCLSASTPKNYTQSHPSDLTSASFAADQHNLQMKQKSHQKASSSYTHNLPPLTAFPPQTAKHSHTASQSDSKVANSGSWAYPARNSASSTKPAAIQLSDSLNHALRTQQTQVSIPPLSPPRRSGSTQLPTIAQIHSQNAQRSYQSSSVALPSTSPKPSYSHASQHSPHRQAYTGSGEAKHYPPPTYRTYHLPGSALSYTTEVPFPSPSRSRPAPLSQTATSPRSAHPQQHHDHQRAAMEHGSPVAIHRDTLGHSQHATGPQALDGHTSNSSLPAAGESWTPYLGNPRHTKPARSISSWDAVQGTRPTEAV